MIETAVGITSICLATTSLLLILWNPYFKYPLLLVLQAMSAALWLTYSIMVANPILVIGNSLSLGILVIFAAHASLSFSNGRRVVQYRRGAAPAANPVEWQYGPVLDQHAAYPYQQD